MHKMKKAHTQTNTNTATAAKLPTNGGRGSNAARIRARDPQTGAAENIRARLLYFRLQGFFIFQSTGFFISRTAGFLYPKCRGLIKGKGK